MAKKRYKTIGLGGTFDHFHNGHASFVEFAAGLADRLVVGITDPELTKFKPWQETIQPYFKRAQSVHRFCQRYQIKHQIIRLIDPFGPTIEPGAKIDALAVTESTIAGGDKINEIRRGMKLRDLPIHIHKLLEDEDGKTLAAFRIRSGVVNREGVVYGHAFANDLKLSQNQREFFQKVHGEIVEQPMLHAKFRIAIGDITLRKFQSSRWPFSLGIYDGHSQRQKIDHIFVEPPENIPKIKNPAGVITNQIFKFLADFFENSEGRQKQKRKQNLLMIDGEEDLAGVAAILAAPLNTIIYYGQPDQGLVELTVTEKIKDHFYYLLSGH